MSTFADLAAGLSRDDAVAAFLDGCNRPDRMNVSTYRQETLVPDLRRLLPDPITEAVAEALIEVAFRRRRLEDVIEWLELQPMTWQHYTDVYVVSRQRAAEIHEMARGYATAVEPPRRLSKWWKRAAGDFARTAAQAIERHATEARPCPQCGRPPAQLRWVEYCSPAESWQHRGGSAGWMTVCDACRLRIDGFIEVMN